MKITTNLEAGRGQEIAYLLLGLVEDINKWNSTEVFQLTPENNWKIVHSHWAFMRPMDMVFDPEKQIV